LVCVLAGGLAGAQSPNMIQNARNSINAAQQTEAATQNAALGIGTKASPAATRSTTAAQTGGSGTVSVKRSAATAGKVQLKAKPAGGTHKQAAAKVAEAKSTAPIPGTSASATPVASDAVDAEDPAGSEKKYNPNGRRDPFISPVVSHAGGSGCSSGKKCLEIGAINLQGIVRSETGFIAVVSNGMNKAYFLRENDPVFNGYVVKITGDSIVFQETLQDRLGKTFTREVVKKITTPAV